MQFQTDNDEENGWLNDTSLTDILDGMASKLNGTILRVNVDENNILMEPSQSTKIPPVCYWHLITGFKSYQLWEQRRYKQDVEYADLIHKPGDAQGAYPIKIEEYGYGSPMGDHEMFMIIDIVDDDDDICSHEDLRKYFRNVVYPLRINKYQINQCKGSNEDGEPLITSLVLHAISCGTFTRGAHTVQAMQPEGEEEKCQGIAVSLTSLLENFGFTGVDQLPDVDQIKNHINNHGIGKTKKINQVFNVNVKMTATMCPLHTRPASWF
ncbi:hypothetical protein OS493_009008 [Desmophyllum pertusum]|uniref:Uncharacterized protein n=1 Tax=Desmophyllum pertusum TaxID=174260 RepID=A0A9W9ZFA7_9CNID|nr:hypothetical protein OS493_009008 [Desmophyllum pertusum]